MARHPELIRSAAEAIENIGALRSELEKEPKLRNRLGYAHAWYAARMPDGSFEFGFSKKIALRGVNAKRYLELAGAMGVADGRRTERHLSTWFEKIDLNTPLGRDLLEALRLFLARWDRVPRKPVRISILKEDLDDLSREGMAQTQGHDLRAHISVDPRICGGRPCIKGTRMRVSDIVDMVANGASSQQIANDFPYITEQDVMAALAFAARAVDHRIVQAA